MGGKAFPALGPMVRVSELAAAAAGVGAAAVGAAAVGAAGVGAADVEAGVEVACPGPPGVGLAMASV
jgi:hypothetical protein